MVTLVLSLVALLLAFATFLVAVRQLDEARRQALLAETQTKIAEDQHRLTLAEFSRRPDLELRLDWVLGDEETELAAHESHALERKLLTGSFVRVADLSPAMSQRMSLFSPHPEGGQASTQVRLAGYLGPRLDLGPPRGEWQLLYLDPALSRWLLFRPDDVVPETRTSAARQDDGRDVVWLRVDAPVTIGEEEVRSLGQLTSAFGSDRIRVPKDGEVSVSVLVTVKNRGRRPAEWILAWVSLPDWVREPAWRAESAATDSRPDDEHRLLRVYRSPLPPQDSRIWKLSFAVGGDVASNFRLTVSAAADAMPEGVLREEAEKKWEVLIA